MKYPTLQNNTTQHAADLETRAEDTLMARETLGFPEPLILAGLYKCLLFLLYFPHQKC